MPLKLILQPTEVLCSADLNTSKIVVARIFPYRILDSHMR